MSRAVKRLFKILLITAVAVILLVLGGVWWLNRWVQSPETHALVERELSRALKLPLKFQSLNLSAWGGLTAGGVTVPDEKGNFFEVRRLTAKHRFRSLLERKFIFEEISVESPKFVVRQQPDGKWAVPSLRKDEQRKAAPEKKDDTPKTAKPQGTPKPPKESVVLIEKIKVRGATVDMFDKDGVPFASAHGVRITLKDVSEKKIEGHVTAARVVLHGWLAISDFVAGVSNTEEKGLIIPGFSAMVGGGKASGGYSRKEGKPKSTFSGRLLIENADITRASLDGGAPPPNLMGVVSADIFVRGTDDNADELSGNATVKLTNGTCKEIEMVRDYGELLRIDDAAGFGIPDATATVSIWHNRLTVKNLAINAPPLAITATGTAKLDGKMELAAKLTVGADFLERQQAIAAQFGPPDEKGRRSLDFGIRGSFTKPKTDLKERITGSKSKNTQNTILLESALEAAFPRESQPGKKPAPQPEQQPR